MKKRALIILALVLLFLPWVAEAVMTLDTIPIMHQIRDNFTGDAPYQPEDPLYGYMNFNDIKQEFPQEVSKRRSAARIVSLRSIILNEDTCGSVLNRATRMAMEIPRHSVQCTSVLPSKNKTEPGKSPIPNIISIKEGVL